MPECVGCGGWLTPGVFACEICGRPRVLSQVASNGRASSADSPHPGESSAAGSSSDVSAAGAVVVTDLSPGESSSAVSSPDTPAGAMSDVAASAPAPARKRSERARKSTTARKAAAVALEGTSTVEAVAAEQGVKAAPSKRRQPRARKSTSTRPAAAIPADGSVAEEAVAEEAVAEEAVAEEVASAEVSEEEVAQVVAPTPEATVGETPQVQVAVPEEEVKAAPPKQRKPRTRKSTSTKPPTAPVDQSPSAEPIGASSAEPIEAAPAEAIAVPVDEVALLADALLSEVLSEHPTEGDLAATRPSRTRRQPRPSGKPVTCSACGGVNRAGSVFCRSCGLALEPSPISAESAATSTISFPAPPSPPAKPLVRESDDWVIRSGPRPAAPTKPEVEPDLPLTTEDEHPPSPVDDATAVQTIEAPSVEVEPAQVEVEPAQVEVEPAQVEVEPAQVEVEPAQVEVLPVNVEVEPAQAEVEPAQVEVLPVNHEVLPAPAVEIPSVATEPRAATPSLSQSTLARLARVASLTLSFGAGLMICMWVSWDATIGYYSHSLPASSIVKSLIAVATALLVALYLRTPNARSSLAAKAGLAALVLVIGVVLVVTGFEDPHPAGYGSLLATLIRNGSGRAGWITFGQSISIAAKAIWAVIVAGALLSTIASTLQRSAATQGTEPADEGAAELVPTE